MIALSVGVSHRSCASGEAAGSVSIVACGIPAVAGQGVGRIKAGMVSVRLGRPFAIPSLASATTERPDGGTFPPKHPARRNHQQVGGVKSIARFSVSYTPPRARGGIVISRHK